jgi:sarcosine oxidase subunit delta
VRISCPHCGLCDHTEFAYGGDAARDRPGLADAVEQWTDYVYLRDNPRGAHVEYWQHVHGCREWLIVERDTLSHDVRSVILARTSPQRAAAPADTDVRSSDGAAADPTGPHASDGAGGINGAAHDGVRQPDGEAQ